MEINNQPLEIEARVRMLDGLEHYKLVYDENEMRWFYDHVISKPNFDEAYAFCLAHRSKKLTAEERKDFRSKASEMLDPQVSFPARDGSFNFDKWAKSIYRYECSKKAYTMVGDQTLFAKALVCYCTPNPSDERAVIKELKSYINVHEQELVDSALKTDERARALNNLVTRALNGEDVSEDIKRLLVKGERSGVDESLYKLCHSLVKFKRLQFDCTGSRNWVDFDMDVKDKEFKEELYKAAHNAFLKKVGKKNFVVVETNGGFHILVRKEVLKFNPYDLINEVLAVNIANGKTAKEAIDEFIYNTNCMLPVPGTYQYGFQVFVRNKEDFE